MSDFSNKDNKTVDSFGDEWTRFDQSKLSREEKESIFNDYFLIFPWEKLGETSIGADIGCGSGRWASLSAQKVGKLYCIDASLDALQIAKQNLKNYSNVSFYHSDLNEIPIKNESLDFAYSLGVLHHIPDTLQGIQNCAKLLKSGAPFLVYLYYRFDSKPKWFQLTWKVSDLIRMLICRMSPFFKNIICNILALLIYYPFARLSLLAEYLGFDVKNIPLAYYRKCSFYTMRTDARDRFGTPLESRFTKKEINEMLIKSGFKDIIFSNSPPFWCAVGIKE